MPVGKVLSEAPACMQNGWLWCKPGDLIMIDEAQFVMPRGTLGRKPPYWLQAMEIHRHYGVDFLIVTQHPQLIDTTVRALVGLHRHVRSVMGSQLCMVYTWDHASNPERFSNATKSQFIRRKAHYKLFHSAATHIKPPQLGPLDHVHRAAAGFVPGLQGLGLLRRQAGADGCCGPPGRASRQAGPARQGCRTRRTGRAAAARHGHSWLLEPW